MRTAPLRWLLPLLLLPVAAAPAQRTPRPPIVFRIGFWNNLHHFLYVLGRARTGEADARRDAVARAPLELATLADRSDAERTAWQAAMDFYAAGPSKQDAVFDKPLIQATQVLSSAEDSAALSRAALDPALAAALTRAAPVYRAVWWDAHRRADESRRANLEPLIAQYGAALVERLTSVYHAQWPSEPRVVNLAAYTNWAGAYSTDGGLIEFSSTDASIAGAVGLEILFHESSHQWDDQTAQRLSSVAESQGRRVPGGLSHAIVFYTAGAAVKDVIPDHVPYAERFGIWNRGAMRGMKPVLDEYWRPYLEGRGTLDDALGSLVAHLQ